MLRRALPVLVALVAISCGSSTPALTDTHRQAIAGALKDRALTPPTKLAINEAGFLVAEWELDDAHVRKLAIPLRTFAEQRLLVIREAALQHGFQHYRVNINGPSPGTGLVKRYGSARLTAGGSLEWLTP